MNRKKYFLKYLFPICAVAAAIVLQALPFSLTCSWTMENGEVIVERYSYYNGEVFSRGVFGPLVSGTVSIFLLLIIIAIAAKGEPNYKQHRNMVAYSVITLLASLTPLILGKEWYSVYSMIISALILATAIFMHRMSAGVQAAEEAMKKEKERRERQARQQAASSNKKKK